MIRNLLLASFILLFTEQYASLSTRMLTSRTIRPRGLSSSASSLKATSSGSISTALETIREKLDVPPELLLTTVEQAPNYRLSASEAAIKSGSPIGGARRDLMTLATLTGGDLEVTADGDIIYAYPHNFRRILSQRSLGQKIRNLKNKVLPVLYKMLRLSVSAALFTSLIIITITIALAMSSSDSDSDSDSDRKSRRRRSVSVNYFDFSTTTTTDASKSVGANTTEIGFFESFFSFVFGDGNPNQEFSSTQFQKAAQLIRNCNGVVTAEELASIFDAPFGPPAAAGIDNEPESAVVSESWVLPALIQFGGEPIVGEDGNIYYKFEELMQTSSNPQTEQLVVTKRMEEAPLESQIPFSKAHPTSLSCAAILGVVNMIGVYVLKDIIKAPVMLARYKYIKWVGTIYPLLVAYAGAYLAIPVIRSLRLAFLNRGIRKRNTRRQQWLEYCASERVKTKFAKACELAVGMANQRKEKLQMLSSLNTQMYPVNELKFE